MTEIQLNVQPGFVAAFYFVVFDHFALALIDLALARGVNVYYYRRIMSGYPVNVRSVDLPGVTSYLVDRFYAPINLVTILIKLLFLAIFFFADLEINSRAKQSSTSVFNNAQYFFNSSRAAGRVGFSSPPSRRDRTWQYSRYCYEQEDDNIDYYPVSFNFSDSEQETIDFSTVRCMAPPVEASMPSVSVVGCSSYMSTDCQGRSVVRVDNGFLPPLNSSGGLKVFLGITDPTVLYSVETYDWSEVESTFPDYTNCSVYCVRTEAGPVGTDERREFSNCLLYLPKADNSTTLIELWTLSSNGTYLERKYPGPLFEGYIEIGNGDALKLLSSPVLEPDWKDLSGAFVADAVEYSSKAQQFSTVQDTGTVTVISTIGWILAPIPLVVGIFLRIVVFKRLKSDIRPQINSVDGLSSIVREEQEPTGRSIDQGRTAIVGLYMRGNSAIRFGPVRDIFETTRAPKGAKFI